MKKLMILPLSVLALSLTLNSCSKEHECSCTESYSSNYGGQIFTDSETYDLTAGEKCVELNYERTEMEDGYTTTRKMECENK